MDGLVAKALDLPPRKRPGFLDTACHGNPELRRRVEVRLEVLDDATEIGEASPPSPRGPGQAGHHTEASRSGTGTGDNPEIGASIGRYKLLEKIGEGGFGLVYVAEQSEPVRRRVALKVIKLGMDTKAVVARFEAERQALALMDHPNIARVLDGGTTPRGRPYFVMELVRGIRITDYCDQNRLTVVQRIELFIKVCQAVQHAHQKGIIHRDLKPSNILVALHDGEAVPKVIDFGIAKATEGRLTEHTVYTQMNQFIGTPAYMSPEMAEMGGLDIDTRSDIYSLGVLLYELLAGRTPFETRELLASGVDGMRQMIRDREPPTPSTRIVGQEEPARNSIAQRRASDVPRLVRSVRGDLDWIVMRCLEKDQSRRYETATGLAVDLRRHLENEPVSARPPSLAYRTTKLWRRYRTAVLAAVLCVVVLLGATGVSIFQALRARQASREADHQRVIAGGEAREAAVARQRAESALGTLETNSYVANIQMAGVYLELRRIDRVRERLEACPERLRGWEWHWLNAALDNSLLTLRGHSDTNLVAAFSTDAQRITTLGRDAVRIWDAASGKPVAELTGWHHSLSGGESVFFSADGKRVLIASTNRTPARVLETATGTPVATLQELKDPVSAAAFDPTGQHLVTGAPDGTVSLWDIPPGRRMLEVRGTGSATRSMTFSRDGQWIAAGFADGSVWTRGVATDKEPAPLERATNQVASIAFSPDGAYVVVASTDGAARVWATSGRFRGERQGPGGAVLASCFSPDGGRMAMGLADGTAQVWDIATLDLVADLRGHTGGVQSIAFSPDGTRLVSASNDGTVRVWDALGDGLQTVIQTGDGNQNPIRSGGFTTDGRQVVTQHAGETTRVWDAWTGEELPDAGAEIHHSTATNSPLSLLGSETGIVRVTASSGGRELAELKGHRGRILNATLDPSGRRILTTSEDGTIRIWESVPYRERLPAITRLREAKGSAEEQARRQSEKDSTVRLTDDKPFTPGERLVLGLPVRWIPPGSFLMGSMDPEESRGVDEVQHEVVLSRGFFMAETECTQGQWAAIRGGDPSNFWGRNRPVEQVSWEEAVEFCNRLTEFQRKNGILPPNWTWRLPTEAEWEYAARAGNEGERPGELDAIAWYGGNSGSQTHPVGTKLPNAWGLHDMIGNVWEWCSDWYGDYRTERVTDPMGPSSGTVRCGRGGSWFNVQGLSRTASRSWGAPTLRNRNLGFRPALSRTE
jgi:WD40 repeat protein/serine/threonine protein kinase/formylglycine-generating enzyme required for sulfatase activity